MKKISFYTAEIRNKLQYVDHAKNNNVISNLTKNTWFPINVHIKAAIFIGKMQYPKTHTD